MGYGGGTSANFFLGAVSPQGFVSRYAQCYNIDEDGYIYILKGGPGLGKTDFIKKLIALLSEYDDNIEIIHSSLNPDCYDGVIFHSLRAAVVDGTSPHVLEPRYYDAFETILPLGECCNKDILRESRDEILSLTDKSTQLLERSVRFIAAAGSLLNDTYRLSLTCTDESKVTSFVERTLQKEVKTRKPYPGKERCRFLSAVTPNGVVRFDKTVSFYCDKVYIFDDDFGAASNIAMHKLREGILERGCEIISCCCPISPFEKLEHLMVPELRLGFVTANRWHPFDFENGRTIHARRFTDLEKLSVRKQRISFNRRATQELTDAAASVLQQAKETDTELEKLYRAATDFEKVDEYMKTAVKGILAMNKIDS